MGISESYIPRLKNVKNTSFLKPPAKKMLSFLKATHLKNLK